jgi:hypothetical protein
MTDPSPVGALGSPDEQTATRVDKGTLCAGTGSTASTDEGYPINECPKCGEQQQDFDGFGVLFCHGCGHCEHPSIAGDVCGLCGKVVLS